MLPTLFLIPGAFRCDHRDLPGLVSCLNGAAAIIICQRGKKLSQGVAAYLNAEGLKAEYLQGGTLGWAAQFPTFRVPAKAIPDPVHGASLWVTRHRPKIDRIACPWLIRRFVDRKARVLFVAPTEVAGVADRLGATPFDGPDTVWGHCGAGCTFDTMLETWNLKTEALQTLAAVVRAADTGQHDLHPAASGLHAISVGLSRQYRNDQAQLSAGLTLYDALYRWARDGQGETHTDTCAPSRRSQDTEQAQ